MTFDPKAIATATCRSPEYSVIDNCVGVLTPIATQAISECAGQKSEITCITQKMSEKTAQLLKDNTTPADAPVMPAVDGELEPGAETADDGGSSVVDESGAGEPSNMKAAYSRCIAGVNYDAAKVQAVCAPLLPGGSAVPLTPKVDCKENETLNSATGKCDQKQKDDSGFAEGLYIRFPFSFNYSAFSDVGADMPGNSFDLDMGGTVDGGGVESGYYALLDGTTDEGTASNTSSSLSGTNYPRSGMDVGFKTGVGVDYIFDGGFVLGVAGIYQFARGTRPSSVNNDMPWEDKNGNFHYVGAEFPRLGFAYKRFKGVVGLDIGAGFFNDTWWFGAAGKRKDENALLLGPFLEIEGMVLDTEVFKLAITGRTGGLFKCSKTEIFGQEEYFGVSTWQNSVGLNFYFKGL